MKKTQAVGGTPEEYNDKVAEPYRLLARIVGLRWKFQAPECLKSDRGINKTGPGQNHEDHCQTGSAVWFRFITALAEGLKEDPAAWR